MIKKKKITYFFPNSIAEWKRGEENMQIVKRNLLYKK